MSPIFSSIYGLVFTGMLLISTPSIYKRFFAQFTSPTSDQANPTDKLAKRSLQIEIRIQRQ
jgi:hypothetical protein